MAVLQHSGSRLHGVSYLGIMMALFGAVCWSVLTGLGEAGGIMLLLGANVIIGVADVVLATTLGERKHKKAPGCIGEGL